MKSISVILAHPYPESFNHAVFHQCINSLTRGGHTVYAHDLYMEHFNPLLSGVDLATDALPADVAQYCDELVASDGLVFIHPNWWGQPPAILKGWIDRVVRNGLAFSFHDGDSGGGVPEGLLKGKVGIVFNTSNTPPERERNVFGDPLDIIWKKCIFEFCGITNSYRRMFCVVADSTKEQRSMWLGEVERTLALFFDN